MGPLIFHFCICTTCTYSYLVCTFGVLLFFFLSSICDICGREGATLAVFQLIIEIYDLNVGIGKNKNGVEEIQPIPTCLFIILMLMPCTTKSVTTSLGSSSPIISNRQIPMGRTGKILTYSQQYSYTKCRIYIS